MARSTPVSEASNAAVRRMVTQRPRSIVALSPIERWAYAYSSLLQLNFTWQQTSRDYRLSAPLHGHAATAVHVDLTPEHLIVLLAPNGDALAPDFQEYYCEAALPADAERRTALVEISEGRLTVTLRKKTSPWASLLAWFHRFWQPVTRPVEEQYQAGQL